MKIALAIIIGAFSIFKLAAQDSTYYWYKGQKQYLEVTNLSEFILINEDCSKTALEQDVEVQGSVSVRHISEKTFQENFISLEPKTYKWAIIDKYKNEKIKIESQESIEYSAPFLITNNGIKIGISHLFYVKLKKRAGYAFSIHEISIYYSRALTRLFLFPPIIF
ncbi:MAG: hypothetical protein K8R52_00830 [Bacteroidales bacterium]|nr:hypothetical protein [Bacteroidales bacterium]